MGIWKSLIGLVDVMLTSASPEQMLNLMNDMGIHFLGVKYVDDLNVLVTVYRHDFPLLRTVAQKRGEAYQIQRQYGVYWTLKRLLYRPVLTFGIALLVLLAMFLPSRVLFVCVDGNETIPANLIIEKAEQCGITFGSSRVLVRSERVKNRLLSAIPQLQWAGINTYGCVAVISVNERQTSDVKQQTFGNVSGIVAAQDGVIQEMTVYRGNPLCKPGQAVEEGQLLVSAYTDCGILIKAVRADAEITAITHRNLEAAAQLPTQERTAQLASNRKYSVIIGKKLINLYKGSGISDTGCVKIRTQSNLTLPGGFVLPIVLVEERFESYELSEPVQHVAIDHDWLHSFAEEYLQSQMIAGSILKRQVDTMVGVDAVTLSGTYDCLEMIGKMQSEEIIQGNGKSG